MNARHRMLQDPVNPPAEPFLACVPTGLHETLHSEDQTSEAREARDAKVRETAYFRAQARGFEPGHELEDWIAAEHEVDVRSFAAGAPAGFTG